MRLTAVRPFAPPEDRGVAPDAAASPAPLLLLLLAADALFILLHLAHINTPVFSDPRFSLEVERGFGEVFQYLKEYWAALLLLLSGVRQRAPLLVVWSALFGYLLIDDAFEVHERLGAMIAQRFQLPDTMVRGRDVGEVLVAAAVGGLGLVAIAVAHFRSGRRARRASGRLLGLVALLAGVGVGVDFLHQMVGRGAWATVLGALEDGGELLVMTAIVWFVAGLYRAPVPAIERRGDPAGHSGSHGS
jgi:hypothetical protein